MIPCLFHISRIWLQVSRCDFSSSTESGNHWGVLGSSTHSIFLSSSKYHWFQVWWVRAVQCSYSWSIKLKKSFRGHLRSFTRYKKNYKPYDQQLYKNHNSNLLHRPWFFRYIGLHRQGILFWYLWIDWFLLFLNRLLSLVELRPFHCWLNSVSIYLRQVSGINHLIKMNTYRLARGDSEITWVGWLIQSNT